MPVLTIDALPTLNECRWYHSMDLPGIGTVTGDWDLRGRFDDYVAQCPMDGCTVLDLGTASGFLSFEAECRGATVTSFDAASPDQWQMVPPAAPDRAYYEGMRQGYRFAHRVLKSKAAVVLGDIYNAAAIAPASDIVIVSQILVHLRDPLGALQQAASLAKKRLVIAEGMADSTLPIAYYLGSRSTYGWWQLSPTVYRDWLSALGFSIVTSSLSHYRCNVPGYIDAGIQTIIAERTMSPRLA